MSPAPVLVAGAGPVGTALAIGLARAGVPVRVVDQAVERSRFSKALVLWPPTQAVLSDLGCADPRAAGGVDVRRLTLLRGTRPQVRLPFEMPPWPLPVALPQYTTELLLEERLDELGVVVERGRRLTGLQGAHDGVTVTLGGADGGDPERVTVPWLAACDGGGSVTRGLLGMEFRGATTSATWVVADVIVDGPVPPDEISCWWARDGFLATLPVAPPRMQVVADVRTPRGQEPREPRLEEVQAIVAARGPGGLTIREPHWLGAFRINERQVRRYRAGRVLLLGDAAHVHGPAGGQGLNTGLQDAHELAWRLAMLTAGEADERILVSWEAERLAAGARALALSGRLTRLTSVPGRLSRVVRDTLAAGVARRPGALVRGARQMAQVDMRLDETPATRDSGPRAPVRAGSRLPPVLLRSAAGGGLVPATAALVAERPLLVLMDGREAPDPSGRDALASAARRRLGGRVALAVVAASPFGASGPRGVPVWVDPAGDLHRLLGADRPLAVVIRPDGYVAQRAPIDGGSGLLGSLAEGLGLTSG